MGPLALVRLALYADLGVVFGVPAALALTGAAAAKPGGRRLVLGAAVLGLPLSCLGYLLAVAEMSGTPLSQLDWSLVRDLLTMMPLGWAFLARIAALFLVIAFWFAPDQLRRAGLVAGLAALATLAWSGHAAASEGTAGLLRQSADIVHLLAASLWVGALALFLILLWAPSAATESAAPLHRFARIGSVLVSLLALTGLANLWFLVPPAEWRGLLATRYGWLLAAKLCAFAAMLMLAGLNRYRLVPALAGPEGRMAALSRLRLSIAVELGFGLGVLALVATLGMLDPTAA